MRRQRKTSESKYSNSPSEDESCRLCDSFKDSLLLLLLLLLRLYIIQRQIYIFFTKHISLVVILSLSLSLHRAV